MRDPITVPLVQAHEYVPSRLLVHAPVRHGLGFTPQGLAFTHLACSPVCASTKPGGQMQRAVTAPLDNVCA